MPTTRFVILHHREASGEHWDLMIEQSEALATWRLERLPLPDEPTAIEATRINDHRKAYLTYEGPLTQDRGDVTRVVAGTCEILTQRDTNWSIELRGDALSGSYELRQIADDRWLLVTPE